jgi:hypothetical protein
MLFPRTLLALTALGVSCLSAVAAPVSRLAQPGPDGKLVYAATSPDGDRLLDFSHCGYGEAGLSCPWRR